jgi:glycosyltransferase involved in cell wall biosynthesis
MHDKDTDRPLVTFALFAYNQEQYIREAVEGAFAQTYEPLEIILSDDCSRDQTFEIMQEMAAAYEGPHEVIVRRNELNLGTAQHVQAVVNKMSGAFIIVAAGDDISNPDRTKKIITTWLMSKNKVVCAHSGAIFFNDRNDYQQSRPPRQESIEDKSERMNFLLTDRLPFLSPTCAYSKEIFENFAPLIGGSIIEDGVLAFRSLASGSILSIKEPLVKIRVQDESAGTGYTIDDPIRWNRFLISRIMSYLNILGDVSSTNLEIPVKKFLEKDCQTKISRLSRFILCPTRPPSFFRKMQFFVKYVTFYPTSAPLQNRIADCLKIIKMRESKIYRVGNLLLSKPSK